MGNIDLAVRLLDALAKQGVRDVCVAHGARNAPLLEVLRQSKGWRIRSFVDERSAAFFALGCIKRTGQPAAVITTSGTAAAELLPAVIEAFYSGLPLILITADRPRSFRGSGAPQSIEQTSLFSGYVHYAWDLVETDELLQPEKLPAAPIHINVCFDEPLLDNIVNDVSFSWCEKISPVLCAMENEKDVKERNRLHTFFSQVHFPVVVVGAIEPAMRTKVAQMLLQYGLPVYAEALSGLREYRELEHLLLTSGDRILSHAVDEKRVDGVLRIGHVPVTRFWRDLEQRYTELPVLSVNHLPFSGLSRENKPPVSWNRAFQYASQHSFEYTSALKRMDQKHTRRLEDLLISEPDSEPAVFRAISQRMESHARLFLGNSMPVRMWDLCALRTTNNRCLAGNRGANGIDGIVSTFLGFAKTNERNYCVLGDMSALHDLNSLSVLPRLPKQDLCIIVINNYGGRIFERIFESEFYVRPHSFSFKGWAELFSMNYRCYVGNQMPDSFPSGSVLIEIRPDLQASRRFWNVYDGDKS